MNSEFFVDGILQSVIKENLEINHKLFFEKKVDEVKDDYWKKALHLFQTLSQDDRDTFFNVLRQVATDTASNLLGILDGSSALSGKFENFDLIHKDSGEKINGELQDNFLIKSLS